MTTLQQQYLQLVSLTKHYLLRETSLKKRLRVSPDDLEYFREAFKKSKCEKKPRQKSEPSTIKIDHNEHSLTNTVRDPHFPNPISPSKLQQNEIESNLQHSSLTQEPSPVPDLSKESTPDNIDPPLPPVPPQSEPNHVLKAERGDTLNSPTQAKMTQTEKAPYIKLEPILSAEKPSSFSDWMQVFKNVFPNLTLYETPPSDLEAKKFQNQWKQAQEILPVMILAFNKDKVHEQFLKSIAQAISLRLAPARVIFVDEWKKNHPWDQLIESPNLRLVIANDYEIYMQSELMQYYKENTNEGKHFLGRVPLLLLSELSLYLKEPSLKALLWRAICNEFATFKKTEN